jgi:hypothetical protein
MIFMTLARYGEITITVGASHSRRKGLGDIYQHAQNLEGSHRKFRRRDTGGGQSIRRTGRGLAARRENAVKVGLHRKVKARAIPTRLKSKALLAQKLTKRP